MTHRLGLIVAALLAATHPARAQITVGVVQPLAFGQLITGTTNVVAYTDAFRRGDVTIDGGAKAYFRLVLPATLVSASGETLPVQFLVGDVAFQDNGSPAQPFDPATLVSVHTNKGTVHVFIGGRALPSAAQVAGLYSATMQILVSSSKF